MNDKEKEDPIFADGIMFQRPPENAPKWVKGKVSVNLKKFVDFLRDQRDAGNVSSKGWVNLDLKESKNRTLYFQVNTWKSPETKSVEEVKNEIRESLKKPTPEEEWSSFAKDNYQPEEINPKDIPF